MLRFNASSGTIPNRLAASTAAATSSGDGFAICAGFNPAAAV
jgi:hypothetical protein